MASTAPRVVLRKWLEKPDTEDPERVGRFPLIRLYAVFNVAQCSGVRQPPERAEGCPDPLERGDHWLPGRPVDPPRLREPRAGR